MTELKDSGFWIEKPIWAADRPKKFYTYFVVGRGIFPLDMLREQQAWPASKSDVVALDSVAYKSDRTVQLCSYAEPSRQRWLSAGWPCTSQLKEKTSGAKNERTA
jgi:hypothetical protein